MKYSRLIPWKNNLYEYVAPYVDITVAMKGPKAFVYIIEYKHICKPKGIGPMKLGMELYRNEDNTLSISSFRLNTTTALQHFKSQASWILNWKPQTWLDLKLLHSTIGYADLELLQAKIILIMKTDVYDCVSKMPHTLRVQIHQPAFSDILIHKMTGSWFMAVYGKL